MIHLKLSLSTQNYPKCFDAATSELDASPALLIDPYVVIAFREIILGRTILVVFTGVHLVLKK